MQLTKLFVAGFLGYAVLLVLFAVGAVFLLPHLVRGNLDVLPETFYEMVFYYLGVSVLIATPLMLGSCWCVLRLLGGKE